MKKDIVFDTFVPLPQDLQREVGGDTDYESLDEVVSAQNQFYGETRAFKLKLHGEDVAVVFTRRDGILIYKVKST